MGAELGGSELGGGARVKKFFADNGLSISLFSLFFVCLLAQGATGFFAYNDTLKQAHLPPISWPGFLASGTFLDGVFSNWQAAILQLTVLIGFSSVLRQRGAAHSRKAEDEPKTGDRKAKKAADNFGHMRKLSNLYKNSMSIVFIIFSFCSLQPCFDWLEILQ